MMPILIAVAGIALVGAVVWLIVYVVREATTLKTTAELLQGQLAQFKEGGFDRLVNQKLTSLTERASQEMEAREQLIRRGREELLEQQRRATTAAEEFSRNLGAVTTQVSGLKDLQVKVGELNDLLKPQQLRGELGEVIVRNLIADKLPRGQYEEDYAFADGKKVEFVIKLNNQWIPVDSKLQLEDYKRMRDAADEKQRQSARTEFKRKVKQKLDEVAAYIRPREGTWNFALMVVPSEAVYYDLVAAKDFVEQGGLYDYGRTLNVFLVSPLTFWAYITAIAQGLHGLEIERRAEEILASLQTLSADIRGFASSEFRLIGEHLRNANVKYEEAHDRLRDIEQELTSIERMDTTPTLPNRLVERGTTP